MWEWVIFFATKVTTELVILSIYNQFRVATQLWIKLVYVMLVIYIYIIIYIHTTAYNHIYQS